MPQRPLYRFLLMPLLLVWAAPDSASAVTSRYRFETAYDNVNGGDWYRSYTNETATLAWGESYVMMGLAAMYRATGDPPLPRSALLPRRRGAGRHG